MDSPANGRDFRNQGYPKDWALSGAEPSSGQAAAGEGRSAFMLAGDNPHLAAVGQGLLTNAVPNVADTHVTAGPAALSQAEIIQSSKAIPAAVPQPRTWEIALAGLLVVAGLGAKISHRILR